MASNIIIGSLIACKLLVTPNLDTKIEEKKKTAQKTVQKSGSGTNIMLGNITKKLQEEAQKSQKNQMPNLEIDSESEEKIIIGTVLNIEEKEYWKKNQETNKFFKARKKMLKVKSDNLIDVLYINEDACGLYADIVEEPVNNEIKENQKEAPKKSNKKLSKDEYEEEYIIVPLDYDIKKNEEMKEIKDTDTKKKINEALNSYLKKNNYNIRTEEERIAIQNKIKEQENFYKKVAEKQKKIFSKPKKELINEEYQEKSKKIKQEELAENKKETKLEKEESFFGINIVAKFEEDVKKEQKKKEKKLKKEEKIVKHDSPKKEIKKERVNDFSNGALISRAFKIILKEW